MPSGPADPGRSSTDTEAGLFTDGVAASGACCRAPSVFAALGATGLFFKGRSGVHISIDDRPDCSTHLDPRQEPERVRQPSRRERLNLIQISARKPACQQHSCQAVRWGRSPWNMINDGMMNGPVHWGIAIIGLLGVFVLALGAVALAKHIFAR
ncbi:MAG TPA: hypothetical protein VGS13_07100 [Stellaceae bacterium]|nr:hypothetical protein [Stellaceae bacterium]